MSLAVRRVLVLTACRERWTTDESDQDEEERAWCVCAAATRTHSSRAHKSWKHNCLALWTEVASLKHVLAAAALVVIPPQGRQSVPRAGDQRDGAGVRGADPQADGSGPCAHACLVRRTIPHACRPSHLQAIASTRDLERHLYRMFANAMMYNADGSYVCGACCAGPR